MENSLVLIMNEAVAWFKNPENASIVNAFTNKLKNI